MPKQQQNQPSPWDERSYRLAFALAALISLGIAMPATSRAEGDLNISRDGGNVNVNLNTGTSSDVSIRRSDDIMVIKVPKSYKGGINIDPALKKNSVVQEVETAAGKAITIQSQQIYLHTSDEETGPAPHDSKDRDNRSATKAEGKVEAKSEDGNAKDEPGPGKPGFLQLSPTETGAGNEKPTSHRSERSDRTRAGQSHTENHSHRRNAEPPPSPLDLTRLLEQGSLFSAPVAPSSAYAPPESLSGQRHSGSKPSHSKPIEHTQTAKAQPQSSHSGKSEQIDFASKALHSESPEISPEDVESEPLEADSKRQAAAIQASINGMLRIFFSLIVVLGLVVAFVKLLLPKLLERYPDFFEKLRESRQWSSEMPGQMRHNWHQAEPESTHRREKKASAQPEGPKTNPITALAEQIITPLLNARSTPISVKATPSAQPPAQAPSKKNYLERLKVGGDHFEVLQSTVLGKGKELHLVELKGKQFLVATTPYTVSLLKDLSEEEGIPNPSAGLFHSTEPAARPHSPEANPQRRPEAKRIAPNSTASYQPPSFPNLYADQPKAPRQPDAATPARSETIAYMSDDMPVSQHSRQANAKPYATPPGASGQAQRRSAIPQFPAISVDEDYPTYLNAPQRQQQQGNRPQPAISSPQPAYIDAEEVVVLEDYDDLYGR